MNLEDLFAEINGKEYPFDLSKELEIAAKENDIVVVFGASDDLMEFRGAISDELGAYDGTTAYLNSFGLLQNDCGDEDCPYFEKIKASAKTISAIWDSEGFSWTYDTEIPHKTFVIIEDSDTYCRGIIFYLKDA